MCDVCVCVQSWRGGGVSLETERWGAARLVSRLTLAGLRAADAGRYRCAARTHTGTETEAAADVTLRVLEHAGEIASRHEHLVNE